MATTATFARLNPRNPKSFNHQYALINGIRYHWVDEGETFNPIVFLIHGFPDLWYGWRYQIPFLVSKGYRVIAPDVRGYGGTAAPYAEPGNKEAIRAYGYKNVCKDLAELLKLVGGSDARAVFIGHDWGAAVAWRMALHYPNLVKAVAGVSIPFYPPTDEFIAVEQRSEKWPQFQYQVWCSRIEADDALNSNVKRFLNTIYRGAGEGGKEFFTIKDIGDLPRDLPKTSKLAMTDEEFEYICSEFQRTGFHGALNWYRTRRVNFQDEKALNLPRKINKPALFVPGEGDPVIPHELWKNMPETVPGVVIKPLKVAHWVQTEAPDELNKILGDWLSSLPTSKL